MPLKIVQFLALLLTAFALESKITSLEMLDEVSRDMRLEWPGRRPRGGRSRYADESYEQTPFYSPRAE